MKSASNLELRNKHILYRAGDILVFAALHDGKFAVRHHVGFPVVAENDVAEHFVTRNQWRNVTTVFQDTPTYLVPIGRHLIVLIHEPFFHVWRINETECRASHGFAYHYRIRTVFAHHFVNDIRIGVRQVESVEILFFLRNA